MPAIIEVQTIFGPMHAFEGDFVTQHLLEHGAHTRVELAMLLSVVEGGDDVFDLGGHIGTFAVPMAQKIGPGGRLLAVEGTEANFQLLSRNLTRHAGRGATAVHALIGAKGGRYSVGVPDPKEPPNSGATFYVPDETGDRRMVTIDELMDGHFVPRIVKLDIEGFEVDALRASPRVLAHHPIIYAEANGDALRHNGATAMDFDTILGPLGYRYFRNFGDRNKAHDRFEVREVADLATLGNFFDLLAVHENDPRIARLRSGLGAV